MTVSLTPEEARVLGCLMEKAVTTPDNYPLSVNALINACNQSTNRDPIVSFDESTVERVLESLRDKGVSRRVRATGQRVVKHRHIVDEALQLSVPEYSVLGVLLLRGAQTPVDDKGICGLFGISRSQVSPPTVGTYTALINLVAGSSALSKRIAL